MTTQPRYCRTHGANTVACGCDPATVPDVTTFDARDVLARIENYGYALAQAAELRAQGQMAASAGPRHFASETYADLKADLFKLGQAAS